MSRFRNFQWVDSVFLILLVVGLALVGVGSQVENSLWTAIGGTLFGACVGGLIGSMRLQRVREDVQTMLDHSREDVRSILANSTRADLRSEEEEIDYYRRKWHIYIYTSLNGHLVWRHAVLDFSKSYVAGSIRAEVPIKDLGTVSSYYVFEGACRNQRLILTGRPEKGNEPCTVAIYPFIGQDFRRVGPGVCFITTWDGGEAMAPTLLSLEALEGWDAPGTLPRDLGGQLSKLWQETFLMRNLVPSGKP